MYDTLKIKYRVTNLPQVVLEQKEETFFWLGSKWYPTFNKKTKKLSGYATSIDNLELCLKGSTIFCENSLQKWYMGNNYELFTYKEVLEALEKLNQTLPFNVYEADVVLLAVGAIIEEEAKPILDTWLSLNNKLPKPMTKANKQYGKKFYLTDYNVKGYDKTFEALKHDGKKLDKQLFRFELEIYTRNLRKRKDPISITKVKDLINKDNYQQLAKELMAKYKMIDKTLKVSLSSLDNKQKEILALFQNKEILQQYKIDHFESFRKKRTKFNNIKKLSNCEYLNHIKKQLALSIKTTLF